MTGVSPSSHNRGNLMKNLKLAVVLFLALILALPVCAEIYKYVDENGQNRWTDDLTQVPMKQRASAQRFESVEEMPADAETGQKKKARSDSAVETSVMPYENDDPDRMTELSREALVKEKSDLDTQYKLLLEERKQLEQLRTEANSVSAQEELNKKISSYNDKTEQYETQLDHFNEKINAYNQKSAN
jgi:hypothetical protein